MTETDLNTIIDIRDRVQQLVLNDDFGSSALEGARCLLDEVIMQRCPHHPRTFTREPLDGVLEGKALVTCPACRASVIWPD